MAGLYGLGYGLGQAAQGLTGGALAGMTTKRQWDNEDKKLGMAEEQIAMQKQKAEQEKLDSTINNTLKYIQLGDALSAKYGNDETTINAELQKVLPDIKYTWKANDPFQTIISDDAQYTFKFRKSAAPKFYEIYQKAKESGKPIDPITFMKTAKDVGALDIEVAPNMDVIKSQLVQGQKPPTTRTVQRGENEVTEEWQPETKTWKQVGIGPKKIQSININGPAGQDAITSQGDAVLMGVLDTKDISMRGGERGKVIQYVRSKDPEFDFAANSASINFKKAQGTSNSKALLKTIDPLLNELEKAGRSLGNSKFPLLNKGMNWLKANTGNEDIIAFNNLRDDVIAEVERGLLGSGVLSDTKYIRAAHNVSSAQTFEQLQAAIRNIKLVIAARLEAFEEGPYPKKESKKQPIASKYKILEVVE